MFVSTLVSYILATFKGIIMLSKAEKELIVQIWDKMIPVAEEIGSEALLRYAVLDQVCITNQLFL